MEEERPTNTGSGSQVIQEKLLLQWVTRRLFIQWGSFSHWHDTDPYSIESSSRIVTSWHNQRAQSYIYPTLARVSKFRRFRNAALIFVTTHEEPFLLPHYCGIAHLLLGSLVAKTKYLLHVTLCKCTSYRKIQCLVNTSFHAGEPHWLIVLVIRAQDKQGCPWHQAAWPWTPADVKALHLQLSFCLPLTAETWFRSRASLCGICGEKSSIVTGFSPSTSIFSCQHHSTNSAYSHIFHLSPTRRNLSFCQQCEITY